MFIKLTKFEDDSPIFVRPRDVVYISERPEKPNIENGQQHRSAHTSIGLDKARTGNNHIRVTESVTEILTKIGNG